jgi:DNA-binding NarL/FixJ family response regulator
MSENTVRYHTANVLKKANVSAKQQAALKYSNAGLLG